MRTQSWRLVLGAAVFVAGAVASPLAAQRDRGRDRGDRGDHGDRDRESGSHIDTTFAFAARGTLDVSVMSGSIDVHASTRNEVHINATSEQGVLRLETSAAHISLGVRANRGGDTRMDVTVPVGTRVIAHSLSGDITVRNVRGEVEARSTNGDLKIDDAERVTFEAVSGSVEATRVTGSLTGSSVSGDLVLDGGVGDVDVETVSGEIQLSHSRAKTVRMKCVSGDITFDGAIDPAGRYTFGSHSGTVKLILPESTGATLSVDTFNGDVESDFPMVLTPGERRGRHMEFTIGSGGAHMAIETFSGDVQIRRGRR